jgi:hypothetical protein
VFVTIASVIFAVLVGDPSALALQLAAIPKIEDVPGEAILAKPF